MIKESAHQKTVVEFFRRQYPKLSRCLQASLSGAILAGDAKARAIQINSLKSRGMVIGQSDLFLAVPSQGYHGLYLEMKAESGKLSTEQDLFINDMLTMGYDCYVAFGADDAINKIKNYLKANNEQL